MKQISLNIGESWRDTNYVFYFPLNQLGWLLDQHVLGQYQGLKHLMIGGQYW